MKLGFSLSPGGLLLPYHLGVMDGLRNGGFLTDATPLAGSSAGAIGAAAVACGLDARTVLTATADISATAARLGGARGRLLPLLREKLREFLDDDALETARKREGALVIAYRELFPVNRAIHQTAFKDPEDLVDAVCFSSMFPFFATNWPAAVCTKKPIPRILVDGFFAVPRSRFGCPDFSLAGIHVDRTIYVSVFPQEVVGIDANRTAIICPKYEGPQQMEKLFRAATQSSPAGEFYRMYEDGLRDVETWQSTNTHDGQLDLS